MIFVHQIDERFLLAAGWLGRAVFEDDNPHDVAGRPGTLLLAIGGCGQRREQGVCLGQLFTDWVLTGLTSDHSAFRRLGGPSGLSRAD